MTPKKLKELQAKDMTLTGVRDCVLNTDEAEKHKTQLSRMTEQAHKNLTNAQVKQKTWYDKQTRQRSLEPGQNVLVLPPSHTNQMKAKWQGPFVVTKKVNDLNCEIDVGKK